MKFIYKQIFMALLGIVSILKIQAEVPAVPKIINILEVSSSKKSIILDRGEFEGIKIGSKAKFVLQEGMDKPKLTTVAYGEAIKVHGNYSFWHLGKIENPDLVFKNSQLLYVSMHDIFSGRSDFRVKQEKIVLAPGSPKASLDRNILGQQRALVKGEEDYSFSDKLVETTPNRKHHLETKDFSSWKKDKNKNFGWKDEYRSILEGLSIEELEQVVEADLVRKVNDKWVMQSVTDGVQNKYNEEELGLKKLYHDQKRGESDKTLQSKSSFLSVFDEVREEKKKENMVDKRAIGKIKKDTAFWSGDMNDLELQQFFYRSQLAQEVNRRNKALRQRSGHEVVLRFNKGINQTTDTQDPSNQRTASSLDIGYEFHLMRVGDFLRKFSVDAFYMLGKNYYDAGPINVQGEEKSFQLGLNYYLYNDPAILQEFLLFVGAAYRSGSALLAANTLSQKYIYSITSAPILHGGIKYRFDMSDSYKSFLKIGVAFLGVLSYEPTILRSSDQVVDNINGNIQSNQLKLALGMSVMF